MRAKLGFGWYEFAWTKPWCRCCSFFVQKYFAVLLGLHACCSSHGGGGVITRVHVTSNKMLCLLASDSLRSVFSCFMNITLALETGREHLCVRWEWVPLLGLFFDDETLKKKSCL